MFRKKTALEKFFSFWRTAGISWSVNEIVANPLKYLLNQIAFFMMIGAPKPIYHPQRILHWTIIVLLYFWLFGEKTVASIRLVPDHIWYQIGLGAAGLCVYAFVYRVYIEGERRFKTTRWQRIIKSVKKLVRR